MVDLPMSTTYQGESPFVLTQFWGGDERGGCLQVTMPCSQYAFDQNLIGAVQLDLKDAALLVADIQKWMVQEAKRRQKILREDIKDLEIFDRTIFREIAELEFPDPSLKIAALLTAQFTATKRTTDNETD